MAPTLWKHIGAQIQDANGMFIAQCENAERAAEIVRAINAFEPMREALLSAQGYISDKTRTGKEIAGALALAALAKEGKA